MSSRFHWLSKVAMVAAAPALILAIVFLLPPALAAATDHAQQAAPAHAPAVLPALAALHSLAALPAPPEPPDPPDTPAPRLARHSHPGHDDDGEVSKESAWLGVTLSEINEEGARISDVAEGSPADQAGLKKGDRIVSVEGKKVISSRDVVRAVRSASPGDKIDIKILRDGDERTLTATLEGRRIRDRHEFRFVTPDGKDEDFEIEIPEMDDMHHVPGFHMGMGSSRTWLGVELHQMSPELREALKAPSDRGMLINRVVEDSPAQTAGLKAGDVIISVGGKNVEDYGDIGRVLRDLEAGDSIDVTVVRNGSERSFDVKLDDRPGPARTRRSFYVPGELDPETRIAIEKSVREALESSHEALREVNEQLREEHDRVKEELKIQMKELKEKLKDNPPGVIRARTVHDI